MNKEIKEILDYLKTSSKSKDFCGMMITKSRLDLLLDYITNLEQKYQDAINQSIEDHKYASKKEDEALDYKSRIEKANEFIKNTPLYEITYDYNMEDELEIQNVSDETASNKLLNILNGRSAE